MQAYKILFFGTPDFSAIVLEKLVSSGWPILAVVTAPDKQAGRKKKLTPASVKVLAKKLKIRVLFQPEKVKDPQFIEEIRKIGPDLIIVAAYGQILPEELLAIPKYGSLNLHPSLLPKYRGASPIQAAILAGEKITGVSIILMDEKMDHGPVLAQQELEIPAVNSKITYEDLSKKLAELGANLLINSLPQWLDGKIKPKPQDHTKATFTKIIKKEDGHINWENSAEYIERQIRAFDPWPGTYTIIQNSKIKMQNEKSKSKILKIVKADILEISHKKAPGIIFLTEKRELAVACGKNALILEELQLEGKRKMTAREFLNGHPEIVGSVLE